MIYFLPALGLSAGAILATIGWYYSTDPVNPNCTPRENKGWAMILLAVFIAWVSR